MVSIRKSKTDSNILLLLKRKVIVPNLVIKHRLERRQSGLFILLAIALFLTNAKLLVYIKKTKFISNLRKYHRKIYYGTSKRIFKVRLKFQIFCPLN